MLFLMWQPILRKCINKNIVGYAVVLKRKDWHHTTKDVVTHYRVCSAPRQPLQWLPLGLDLADQALWILWHHHLNRRPSPLSYGIECWRASHQWKTSAHKWHRTLQLRTHWPELAIWFQITPREQGVKSSPVSRGEKNWIWVSTKCLNPRE